MVSMQIHLVAFTEHLRELLVLFLWARGAPSTGVIQNKPRHSIYAVSMFLCLCGLQWL